jgi:POT family proton-dependent oligopeptide transporter
VFWTLFEQAGTSLNLFAERNTDLSLPGGQAMTAAQTQSFNSGFILLLVPVFSALWAWLGARNMDPNPVLKFSLALVQVGLSFLILVWGASVADAQFRIPLMFLAAAYLVQTTGELCLSPVGLSWMTKLSTPTLLSTLMATWFLSSSWAQYLGGFVAEAAAVDTIGGQVLDPGAALQTYVTIFGQLGWWTIGIGIALGLASPFLKRLAHGVK